MITHGGHLAARAWTAAVTAVGTTTLGLILLSVALSLLIWVFGAVYARFTQRGSTGARKTFGQLLASSASNAFITLVALGFIVLLTWCVFVVRTIYFDHMNLARVHAADMKFRDELQRDIEFHRHSESEVSGAAGRVPAHDMASVRKQCEVEWRSACARALTAAESPEIWALGDTADGFVPPPAFNPAAGCTPRTARFCPSAPPR